MDGTDLDSGADFSPRMRHILRPRGLKPESTDKGVMKGNDRLGASSANCPAKVSTHVCKPFGCTNKFSASIAASPLKPMMV
jgi:hypothetical protein